MKYFKRDVFLLRDKLLETQKIRNLLDSLRERERDITEEYDAPVVGPAQYPVEAVAVIGSVVGKLEDVRVEFEVDDGSMVCVMPQQTLERLNLPIEPLDSVTLGMGDGRPVKIIGRCTCEVTVGSKAVEIPFQVIPNAGYQALLGKNWLRALRCSTKHMDDGSTLLVLYG
jgi:sporulation protein YlmC with PRC-barrel domain